MTNIAFVIEPLDTLNLQKDSTLAMLWAAQRRGWATYTLESHEITWRDAGVFLNVRHTSLSVAPNDLSSSANAAFQVGATEKQPAQFFNIIMMRKDPPFDMNYVNTTYLLEQAEALGVLVVNRPEALRNCNEKFFTTAFPDLLPSQIVSSQIAELVAFHHDQGDTIFKPLDGMGGKGIFRATQNDPNLNVILETLTQFETTAIVGQRYLPEIKDGDKRILLLDGEPIPFSLARIPKTGESRGNLAAGGTGIAQPLTNKDREIAAAMAPELVRRGLTFTGIDVIGDYLTEVNVTCPTCIREIDRACNLDIASELLDLLAKKLVN
ncbi:MAG: glutathione synthase [Gammaproteobacteria bacterium]|nr:glutathione synthase [Gammaproteobacteria bacterium]